jgi:hypothetical protein
MAASGQADGRDATVGKPVPAANPAALRSPPAGNPRKAGPAPVGDQGPALLKQPPMPMRRMTAAQRQAAATRLKALREEDARRMGHPAPATKKMIQPQPLPVNREAL